MIKRFFHKIKEKVAGWRAARADRLIRSAEGLEYRARGYIKSFPEQKFHDLDETGIAMLELAGKKRKKARKLWEKARKPAP
ncbi:MAG TPA: hypothetical protein HA254_00170 [Candidatus Diapherotrites archaeon]|uniref:Uncharacterized protein n=1 Tax=Candidatus Iainarchaeum sp. TaxID=3101447 RepID=A0A7J4IXS8_9ARCH|nr:hypothetical protein [Candidatus Diapherotrites archaeon]